VNKTSDNQKGCDWDYTEDETLHQTSVSGWFQQCRQQYVDGYFHATTPIDSIRRIAGLSLSESISL
jgi:hypothetical protein